MLTRADKFQGWCRKPAEELSVFLPAACRCVEIDAHKVLFLVTLLIDTGSSNTWFGAQLLTNPFIPTTSAVTGNLVVCGIVHFCSTVLLAHELTRGL